MNRTQYEIITRRSRNRRRIVAPLFPLAAGLMCGIVLDEAVVPPIALYVTVMVLVCIWLAATRMTRYTRLAALCAGFALGGVAHDNAFRRVPPDDILHFSTKNRTLVRLRATLLHDPERSTPREHFFSRWTYRGRYHRTLLAATAIETEQGWMPVSGLVTLRIEGFYNGPSAGDRVEMLGKLSRITPSRNPGAFDYQGWTQRQGIRAGMVCHADHIEVIGRGGDVVRKLRSRLRQWTTSLLIDSDAALAGEERGLLETIALGRRHAVDRETEEEFIRAGTTHFLAVSGAHLGWLAWLVWTLVMISGVGRRKTAIIVAIVILLYLCVVDARPPVLRAAVIGWSFCAAALLGRHTRSINILSLAAIILLLIRPMMLFGPGFQMSFACVAAIVLLRAPMLDLWFRIVHGRTRDMEALENIREKFQGWRRYWTLGYLLLLDVTFVSLAAWLASTPIIAIHFGRTAPLGWLNSLLMFPLFAATLCLSFITLIVGFIWPILLTILQPTVRFLASTMLGLASILADTTPQLQGLAARALASLSLLLIATIIAIRDTGEGTLWHTMRQKRWGIFAISGIVSLCVTLPFWSIIDRSTTDGLRLTLLSVGRGSSTVIEFPNGDVWLADCGANGAYDVGETTIVPYLETRSIRSIDRVLVSHPNLDHYSGIVTLLDATHVGPVTFNPWFSPFSPRGGPADALLKELDRRQHTILTMMSFDDLDPSVTFEVLWPIDGDKPDSSNNASTVFRIGYQNRTILLCGDIEQQAMAALLTRGNLSSDVLILPHHGSMESNTAAFIAAVDPKICIRSSHVRLADTSEKLKNAIGDRPLFCTADDGAISIEINPDSLTLQGYLTATTRSLSIPHQEH